MTTLNAIIGTIALSVFGYLILKEGLHKDTEYEKMIKATQSPPIKKFHKWYAIMLGIFCIGAALYFALRFFLRALV